MMHMHLYLLVPAVALTCFSKVARASATASSMQPTVIRNNDPAIFFHGRWDRSPGTWWASTGFKLHVEGLSMLGLTLGPHTTSPSTPIGVSIDYGPFNTVDISNGANSIPLEIQGSTETARHVVRINSEGWQNNRVNLEAIKLNAGARLLPYEPSKLAFQFIGDSLSAGQYLPQGVDQAWPFLTGEYFKAEHTVNAQPGAALTDVVSYGNVHGVSFQFFRTEDTGYYDTTDHNFTTPWDFRRDHPAPTHVVIHIGANDSAQNVTGDAFVDTYLKFVSRLRTIYIGQPIFIFTPWGWPQPDGSIRQYYEGRYTEIVNQLHATGDRNVFLVNTTGWIMLQDIFSDNLHPTVAVHQKIAGLFEQWLENWGLKPEKEWATTV